MPPVFVWIYPYFNALASIAVIIATMIFVALLESLAPLRRQTGLAHLVPNLALTGVTFATNAVFNTALVGALTWLELRRFGIGHWFSLSPVAEGAIAVLALDFSFYVLHVAMHKIPALWRYHRVHHTDSVVDVTTTIRQHPGEGVLRYLGLAIAAVPLGLSPGSFAVYRMWSALNGLLEHANIRVPRRLDSAISLITTWPYMHKVHHSRDPLEADTNYGNIFSFWDRIFLTFTSSTRGQNIDYGLDGFDDRRSQSTVGLLALPHRAEPAIELPTRARAHIKPRPASP